MADLVKLIPVIKLGVVAISKDSSNIKESIVGTGFIINNGLIVTCSHVAKCCYRIDNGIAVPASRVAVFHLRVLPEGGVAMLVSPIEEIFDMGEQIVKPEYDHEEEFPLDLAFLKLPARWASELSKFALPIRIGEILEGEQVLVAGFPLGSFVMFKAEDGRIRELNSVVQTGIVSTKMPYANQPQCPRFIVSSPLVGGSSGSPVVSLRDKMVIGMIQSGYENSFITFALSSVMISTSLLNLKDGRSEGKTNVRE